MLLKLRSFFMNTFVDLSILRGIFNEETWKILQELKKKFQIFYKNYEKTYEKLMKFLEIKSVTTNSSENFEGTEQISKKLTRSKFRKKF